MCFIVEFWSMEARRWSDVTGAHPKTSIDHITYMNENVSEDNVGPSHGAGHNVILNWALGT
jgi:endonuclease/exonuclease/phosphatase (EEP) superfamily protein YafD